MIAALIRHLFESTCFTGTVLLLIAILRRETASTRHALLLSAAVKFALPLQALFALGAEVKTRLPVTSEQETAVAPSFLAYAPALPATLSGTDAMTGVLLICWLCVAISLFAVWVRALVKVAIFSGKTVGENTATLDRLRRQMRITQNIGLQLSKSAVQPSLIGLLRPTIVLPETSAKKLSAAELESVLLHELAHAKRRDNLTRSFVHALCCSFWFFPLLWWLERRMHAEGELACDEMVIAAGACRAIYVQSICKVCEQSLLRPIPGRSDVSSSNLDQRLEHIMTFSVSSSTSQLSRALGGLLLGGLLTTTAALGFSSEPAAQNATKTGAAHHSACMLNNQLYSPGAVIRVNGMKHLEICRMESGQPKWFAMAETERDPNLKIVQVNIPTPKTAYCNETAPQGKLCTCDSLSYSPGAVVDSPRGVLVCPVSGGLWQPYKGRQTPWPPVAVSAH